MGFDVKAMMKTTQRQDPLSGLSQVEDGFWRVEAASGELHYFLVKNMEFIPGMLVSAGFRMEQEPLGDPFIFHRNLQATFFGSDPLEFMKRYPKGLEMLVQWQPVIEKTGFLPAWRALDRCSIKPSLELQEAFDFACRETEQWQKIFVAEDLQLI